MDFEASWNVEVDTVVTSTCNIRSCTLYALTMKKGDIDMPFTFRWSRGSRVLLRLGAPRVL